jgi:serine/threonine-protein kinase
MTQGLAESTLHMRPTAALLSCEGSSGEGRSGEARSGEGALARRQEGLHSLPELRLGSDDGDSESGGATTLDLSVLATLGEGGMGVVRLANQLSLDREVAVKTTREGTDEAGAHALLEEAYVTGYLEHPNIIPIYNVGRTEQGAPVIVMKRVEGLSWLELLGRRDHIAAEDFAEHVDILIQVANALRFAHSKGILHRDVKPDNVMIGHFDEVYLLDWGIAVSLDEDRPLLPGRTDASGMSGTPQYMAPEMTVKDVDGLDERTDVYLLGATLHHVLTGRPRHGGDSLLEVLFSAHQSAPYEYAGEVPAELADIANRACHRDKDQRFASVEAFRDALQDFLQHRESVMLSQSAEAKLAELEELLCSDSPDVLGVHDTYGECRFGFFQALRMWPENEQATRGLQRCLEAMATYHLEQGSLDAARSCIADLPEARPALAERAAQLARRLDADGEELERLKRLEHNLDMKKSASARSLLAIILGVLWTATSLYSSIRLDHGEISAAEDHYNHMFSGFRNVVIVLAGVFIFRKRLFVNQVNRRVTYLLISMVVAVSVMRWSVWTVGEGVVVGRVADSMIYAVTMVAVGLMADVRLCLLAVFYGAAGLVGVLWPEWQLYANTAATALTLGGLAWIWSPSRANKKLSL